jgi:carboxypeptidase Taq
MGHFYKEQAVDSKLQDLKTRLVEINDLESAAALLYWDQSTYMPPGGAAARGRQLSTLSRLSHQKFTDPEVGKLLDGLRPYEESLSYDADDAALIRLTRRLYERAIKVPSDFVAKFSNHSAEIYQTWTQARPANDFKQIEPLLEKTLDLSRELAAYFPGYEHIVDPLIDSSDYGMKASEVRRVFEDLRTQLVPLVKAITDQPVADDSCLLKDYPEGPLLDFSLEMAKQYGYDLNRGRQDKTPHPFMTKFSLGDVRITTRVKERDLSYALFSTLHETGHAMYEQGICRDYEGTPLAGGTSSGVHESQSRLWENIVGRSHGVWEYFYPKLQAVFPEQLNSVPLDEFYRAINKVERSLIRTEADEVTYNLHVMIRFGFEMDLLEGKLSIHDLPDAWHEQYKSNLGLSAPDHRDGVMQDVHWFSGSIGGAFQGYTLGNILSAQFYEAALKAHPEIPDQLKQGQFGTLHSWLKDNIYQYGSKYTANEIVERATGGSLNSGPYISYLKSKFGELYPL